MQKVDLYSLLWAYANKVHSPTIKISVFIDFIGKYARQHEADEPEWKVWTQNPLAKFWEEVPALVDVGKCVIQGIASDRFLFLAQYYVAMIALAYKKENDPSLAPFPDERGLKIQVPEEQNTTLRLKEGLADYLDTPDPTHKPIITLLLSAKLGSILLLDSMMPSGLLEIAFLKIRFYLMIPGNHSLILQKLSIQFHELEAYPRDLLNSLLQNPNTCLKEFEDNRENANSFWTHLCNLIKNDVGTKATETQEDITLLQTVAIIEQFNRFFNDKAKQRKSKEKAFEQLSAHLLHSPYLYNMDSISKFVGHEGKPLLEYYSEQELNDFLAEKTAATADHVPELVPILDIKKEQWFIAKSNFALVCIQQLQGVRESLENAILEHWEKLLTSYENEPAMDDDRDFRKQLLQYLKVNKPLLAAMFEYKLLPNLFAEMQTSQNTSTEFVNLFDKKTGKLLGLDEILSLKRRTLLSDARARVPFWFSVPIIVNPVRLLRKKEKEKKAPTPTPAPQSDPLKKEKPLTFMIVCNQFLETLVPPGQTLDSYLARLWDRWAKLIREEDRKNLREDVNMLIRDRIRHTIRILKPAQITETYLSQTAAELIQASAALKQLQNNSLELYIKLYLIKLLRNIPR